MLQRLQTPGIELDARDATSARGGNKCQQNWRKDKGMTAVADLLIIVVWQFSSSSSFCKIAVSILLVINGLCHLLTSIQNQLCSFAIFMSHCVYCLV